MRWIYLSPHLDDAVLSAGGLLYQKARAGMEVEIWTLVSGFPPDEELSPFAQAIHFQWGISSPVEVVRARRAEDEKAAKIIGAKTLHFDFLDCIYRRGKNGDWLYAGIFVPPHEEEAGLPAQMAETIAAQLAPDDVLLCQLGIGSHVDHLLTRRAAELLQRPLIYVADLPYLFRAPEELAPQVAALQETLRPIDSQALKAWQDGVAQYASQIGSLFEDEADMRAKIARYAEENKGLRTWTSPPS